MSCRRFFRAGCVAIIAQMVGSLLSPSLVAAPADSRTVATSVVRLLQQGHYSRTKIDDNMGEKILMAYIESLDYNHLFFTQEDIDEFTAKYGTTMDTLLQRGDLAPAFEIFARYKDRVTQRVANVKELAGKKYDFSSDRMVVLNRTKEPWPKDQADADRLWADRIEGELLQEKLNEHAIDSPQKVVDRRYDQVLRNVREMDEENVTKLMLSAVAQTYDPHSEYLSPSDLENFSIHMRLSLVGVGAVLKSDDGYARVMEVVPGGPADLDGRLKVNDRIAAVAQGTNEFEDVVDMKLDKVVEKIRGKKGSIVRLQVIPGEATDPSKRTVINITRDEVKLKDSEAKAEVIDIPDANGRIRRMGWITLPSFYAAMDRRGEENAKSTTEDVNALLKRLKKEKIEGLVIDLRRDGGGSLEEAINLTGLFIPRGPVVQSKDADGKISVSEDRDPQVQYDGPLVVLTNRLSASASEIFAAALQDYGRAVVVGDERTFGKGTVQTMIEIGKLMPFFSLGAADAGALKLTIQKFYRVKGGSTQQKGVASDIVLPSLTDTPEIGESALKQPLPYDEVAPAKIDGVASGSLFLEQLRERSARRLAGDIEFAYVRDDSARMKAKIEKNAVTLNESARRSELAESKARVEQRKAERAARNEAELRAYSLTLDDVEKPKLELVANLPKKKQALDPDEDIGEGTEAGKDDKPAPDPIKNEALRILHDLVDLTNSSRTAAAAVAR